MLSVKAALSKFIADRIRHFKSPASTLILNKPWLFKKTIIFCVGLVCNLLCVRYLTPRCNYIDSRYTINDPTARVACEVMATAGKIIVAGEITAAELPDIPSIVCRTVRKTGYDCDYEVEVITHDQSADIAGAVNGNQLGAGDQGIMYGYACSETESLLPLPVVLAHRLTRLLTNTRNSGMIPGLKPDGKAQVSVEYEFGVPSRVSAVVVSCQHKAEKDMEQLRREVMEHVIAPALLDFPPDRGTEILINPSGRFVEGGFEADTGLTGRKLMADTYGGLAPHGGGALSGKDGTKVDRSGAYMARYIAKN
ncbi:MAG: hypothetical protein EOM52_02415, partial [Clostridia bacterium]|nr:hypothetical protein [Clostridia bacterium]